MEAKLKAGKVVAHSRDENYHNPAEAERLNSKKLKRMLTKMSIVLISKLLNNSLLFN